MALPATEVSYENTDWNLAAESQSTKPLRAETIPESQVGVGLLAPQSACASKFQCYWPRISQMFDRSLTLSLDKERG
jgi:hypothetical protein